ncbi:hypothetical protein GALMADRAFT_227034 [Galerina marginata CBS 339.88]|uniref:HMG box domain-containing protein n=1 Tax=Galerina marginata (strain CBS 339.88) TaxID=685588 RepID=A0A067T8R8_GALM3|nr:hypothetical protein GALMADRAFT_227034 [Galerina marginata CBS 339.88]
MAGPMRRDALAAVKPPRPPNSWILYRAHVLKNLPPVAPGEPRRSQSDVSALISRMWRQESDTVRAEFERLADEAKERHRIQFPNYRYQPKKKEEKERLKELQKQRKESDRMAKKTRRVGQRTETALVPSHPVVQSGAPYYNPHLLFSSAGPTPPLSASSSPSDATLSPPSRVSPLHGTAGSSSSFLAPLSLPTSTDTPSTTLPYSLTLSPPSHPELPQSHNATEWPFTEHSLPTQTVEEITTDLLVSNNWSDAAVHEQPIPSSSVLFDVPNDQLGWLHDQGGGESFGNFSSVNGQDVFELSQFDPSILSQNPQGEVEVSLGNFPSLQDTSFYDTLFPTNEHSDIPFDSEQQSYDLGQTDFTDIFFNLSDFDNSYGNAQASSSTLMDDAHSLVPSDIASEYSPQQPVASTSYIPPSGAAQSSSRRVGGNWANSIYAREHLLDHSPPHHEVHAR